MFLALTHFDLANIDGGDVLQSLAQWRQVSRLRYQTGIPAHAFRTLCAFVDHATNETQFAATAMQFGSDAAKVGAACAVTIRFAQLAPLGDAGLLHRPCRGVKRRIAYRQVEVFVSIDDTFEDALRIVLATQLNCCSGGWIRVEDVCRRLQCLRRNIGTDKAPAVFGVADQRVDHAGSDTDVEHAHRCPTRDLAVVVTREQIGDVMDQVGASRYARAERGGGQVPASDAVPLSQQGAIERKHRTLVGEIDCAVATTLDDVLA